MDTELEVLALHREADATLMEAKVLEGAERMPVEDGRSESDSVKVEGTSEYVQSQIHL